MLKKIMFGKGNIHIATLIARLVVGVLIFSYGAGKLLGWYGGFGFTATIAYFQQNLGLPPLVTFLVIMVEFFGSLCLIAGFLTRFWAIAMIGNFSVIIIGFQHEHFHMNWLGEVGRTEGCEYHLLIIALSLVIAICGAGKFSLDNKIFKHVV